MEVGLCTLVEVGLYTTLGEVGLCTTLVEVGLCTTLVEVGLCTTLVEVGLCTLLLVTIFQQSMTTKAILSFNPADELYRRIILEDHTSHWRITLDDHTLGSQWRFNNNTDLALSVG